MDRQQFLSDILALVRTNAIRPDPNGGIKVAKLGLAVQRSLAHWSDLGYAKFKDVLLDLEAQGLVRTGPGEKEAFTVWATDRPDMVSSRAPELSPVSRPLRPLHRHVWIAFVGSFPQGKRFLNRDSGDVRMGLSQPPEPPDEWLEIPVIDQQTQRQWTVDFLGEARPPQQDKLQSFLSSDGWFNLFLHELESVGPSWKSRYNRFRSERVLRHVAEWQQKQAVSDNLLFGTADKTGASRLSRAMRVTGTRAGEHERDPKQLLLQVLSRLTIEELVGLNIPTRHVIAVLRPDLYQMICQNTNR